MQTLLATQLEMEKMKVEQERKKAIFVQEAAKEKVPNLNISVQSYWSYDYFSSYLEPETVGINKIDLEQYSVYCSA